LNLEDRQGFTAEVAEVAVATQEIDLVVIANDDRETGKSTS